MTNVFQMMKQAMTMQSKMKALQKELAKHKTEFVARGGLVKVVARGDMTIEKIAVDPSLLNAAEARKLEDTLASAVNGALEAAKKEAAQEMSKMAEGMGLPSDLMGLLK